MRAGTGVSEKMGQMRSSLILVRVKKEKPRISPAALSFWHTVRDSSHPHSVPYRPQQHALNSLGRNEQGSDSAKDTGSREAREVVSVPHLMDEVGMRLSGPGSLGYPPMPRLNLPAAEGLEVQKSLGLI